MPRAVPRGGARQLSPLVRVDALRVAFEISVDEPAVERELQFLVHSAVQGEEPRALVHYGVSRAGDIYEIRREGVLMNVEIELRMVLQDLHTRLHREALAAWPSGVALRALTGGFRGERFVLTGESLPDRSRIGLELLSCGFDVEGDYMAIAHDQGVTAFPRPLRIPDPHVPLPRNAPPRTELPCNGSCWALDLGRAGIDWRIHTGPVQYVILLEANYGGQTRLYEVGGREAAQVLMSHAYALGTPVDAIRTVARLVDRSSCYRLRLGAVDEITSVWPSHARAAPGRHGALKSPFCPV